MRHLLLSLSILFVVMTGTLAGPSVAQDLRSPESFQELYLAALKAEHPAVIVISATVDEVVIKREDGTEFTTFLGNAYRRHMEGQTAEEAVAVLIGLIDSSAEPLTVERAYVLIRPVDFLDPLNAIAAEEGGGWHLPLHRPLVGDLMIIVAQDNDDNFSYPSKKDVETLFGGEGAAWTRILAHTQAQMGEITLEGTSSGVSILSAREDIAASLLLDDAVWSSPDILALGERPAVGVLKSGLLIVDSGSPDARDLLRRVMREAADSSDFLSPNLFVRKDGRWSVLEP